MRRHALGLLTVALAIGGLLAFRRLYIEPRLWGGICAAAHPPLACWPRAALLWLQNLQLWGAGALLLGLGAFLTNSLPVSIAAVAVGAAAVINYNATWGMLGAALGAWTWLRAPPRER